MTFIGRAPEQVDEFIRDHVQPALAPYHEAIRAKQAAQLNV